MSSDKSKSNNSNPLPEGSIDVIGARVHNLKDIDVRIPHNKLEQSIRVRVPPLAAVAFRVPAGAMSPGP